MAVGDAPVRHYHFMKALLEDAARRDARDPSQRYVYKWLAQPFLRVIEADPAFRSFLNHKDLAKEFSESWAIYRRVKSLMKTLRANGNTDIALFDVCSGKGFTAVLLTHMFPGVPVYMLDKNKKMNLNHLEQLPNIKMAHLDILKDKAALPHFVYSVLQPNSVGIIAGMHLCGPLALRFLECFKFVNRVRAMALCPCCLESHKVSDVAAAAKSLDTDNYSHWTDTLLRDLPSGLCKSEIIADTGIISLKNKCILSVKHADVQLEPQDPAPVTVAAAVPHRETKRERRERQNARTDAEFAGMARRFADKWLWLPIRNCPGRYTLDEQWFCGDPVALPIAAGLSPKEAAQVYAGRQEHALEDVRDTVVVQLFADRSGGIIAYRHENGSFLLTLNTPSGFARKVEQLGLSLL
eukprot:TRINITY_DN16954_c0_g1_i1.p1 TRINITY_DN16954_c0_g1~~TRINITY_DN16954_c0_g1_i1.p1  ORF type:complete len:422 (-),score=107.40 TRINITY_DN16954_c0_g1_i1:70-1296(-)